MAQPPSSPSYRFCPVLLLPGLLALGTRLGVDLSVRPLFRAVRLRPATRGVPPSILDSDTAATTAMLRDRLAALCDAASLPRLALLAFRRGRARALRAEGAPDSALRVLGGWMTQQMVSCAPMSMARLSLLACHRRPHPRWSNGCMRALMSSGRARDTRAITNHAR